MKTKSTSTLTFEISIGLTKIRTYVHISVDNVDNVDYILSKDERLRIANIGEMQKYCRVYITNVENS